MWGRPTERYAPNLYRSMPEGDLCQIAVVTIF